MSLHSPLTDVEWLYCVDPLETSLWGLWAVEALTLDGYTLRGTLQGDGEGNWDEETFVEDDTV